ncbi:heterokaryon incompatibility protein-domain-containing protein, partial [Paraphoma chrysanthemicola]
GSDLAVSRAKRWVETCFSEHEECRSTIPRTLPTRLLYINGPEEVRIRRVKVYHERIPWKDLPKTFQHVISFTYRLGIKYLWIDSLCILQNSVEDWQHEGSRMASIYEGAHVTLAASFSPNAYAGCFRKTLDPSKSCCFQLEDTTGNNFAVYTRFILQHHMEGTLVGSVLSQRPWVYQERQLSPRIIHFLDEELWFECCETTQCECSRHTIEEYSKKACNLTFPEDLFPAIQGLAKLMPQASGRYLAGHWEAGLASSLHWLVIPLKDSHLTTAIKWRAPSWSWASAPGWTWWSVGAAFLRDAHACFTVISAKTVPKGLDPTGQLISGELVLNGTCIRGKVCCRELGAPTVDVGHIYPGPEWHTIIHWDRPRLQKLPDGLDVTLLLLYGRDNDIQKRVILKKAHDQDDVYERIGLYSATLPEEGSVESHLDGMHDEEQITVTIV